MAANRYGQIWHGDHHHINIRFPSNEARLQFQNEFEAHHASHDHEGDIPTFINVTTKDLKLSTGSRSPQDLVKAETDKHYRITIDGYSWNEIHEYHNPSGWSNYFHYHVPTCCVPPIIVVDREFVDSGTLQRHELSAIFGDMPTDDFQSLLESVQADGFIDPIVRIHEGQILDGWHRYRAAQELNLIRRLRFQEWHEDEHRDGDPKVFVLARNIERRHLTPAQRAQIAIVFNNRFGHGGDRSKPSKEGLKTHAELAAEMNVSISTIERASKVEKAGQSDAVISGEKTPGQLEREAKEKSYAKLCRAINAFNNVWQKTHLASQVSLSDDFFPAAAEALGFPTNIVEEIYRCQDTPETEEKLKKGVEGTLQLWQSHFDAMRSAIIEKPEWVESLESGTHKETALEHLYQNRQDFQTAVSDFAQSGSYLDFTYCRRRIKSLVGLEDATDEGSTDYTHWDLQKIKAQSHIAAETVLVIKAYLEEDPKVEESPIAALLSEMQRISEIHQSAKLDTYTRPFLHPPLSDAVEKVEKLWTTDWEAQSDEERFEDLNALDAELPSLIEAEDTARSETVKADAGEIESEDTVERKALWEKIDARLPQWKERLPVDNEDVPVENLTKDLLIAKFREYLANSSVGSLIKIEIGEPGTPLSLAELKEFYNVIRNETYGLIFAVRKVLLGETEKLPLQDALDEMKAKDGEATEASETLEQAKIDHANARLAVQSAFFYTNLDDRMTDFEGTDTGGKLKKFFATVVDIKTPKLRFNIFTPDEFFFDTRGDAEHDFSEQYPEMYRGRDLTVSEIRDEIEVLRSISKDIRWYMQSDERHLGWMEQVVEAITPKLEDVREAFLDTRDVLLSAIAETGITCVDFLDAASNYFMGSKHNRPYRTCMQPVAHFKDWSVFNFTSWTEDIKVLHADLLNNAGWVQKLVPTEGEGEPDFEVLQKEHVDRLKALPGEIRAYLPTWQAENPTIEGNITLKLLLNARCQIEFGRERGPDPFFREEMEDLLDRMKSNDAALIEKGRELLGEADASPKPDIPASHNTLVGLAESLMEDFDAHFEALDITGEEAYMELFKKASLHYSFDLTHFLYITNMYDAADYKEAGAFWESLTQPHRHAWMNTLMSMQRDLKNRENWAKGIGGSTENIEDEGLAGTDIRALRDTLSSLLETLGVSDVHLGLKDTLTGDLLNVFLEYENLPTAKEQVIALLDTADCILSEL